DLNRSFGHTRSPSGTVRTATERFGNAASDLTATFGLCLQCDHRLSGHRPSDVGRARPQKKSAEDTMRQLGWMGRFLFLVGMAVLLAPQSAAAAWEPTKPVEFIIPAGT